MGSCGAFRASLTKKSKDSEEVEYLIDVSNDIYFENDNEVCEYFEITKEFIDSLEPGDKLELSADGCEESCGYGSGDEDEDE